MVLGCKNNSKSISENECVKSTAQLIDKFNCCAYRTQRHWRADCTFITDLSSRLMVENIACHTV